MSDKLSREQEEQANAAQEEHKEQDDVNQPQPSGSGEQESPDSQEQEASADQAFREQGKASHWLSNSGLPWTLCGLLALTILVLIIYMKPFGHPQAVAKVNDEPITKDQMYEAVIGQFGPQGVDQVIEQLITEELIRQAAEDKGVAVTEEDLEAELAELREQFPSEEQFQATLEQVGLTEEELKEQMRPQVLLDKMLAPEIQVTEAQVSELFEQRKQELTDPEMIRASHILVDNRDEAEQLLGELQEGADFAALAAEHSTDGSASRGGDLGYFGRGDMVQPFEEAAFALNEGELSEIVESQFGFHLILATDVPRNWTLENKKEELQLELEQQQLGQKRTEWLAGSRDEAKIEKLY
ncbi:peptidylprolyl isomerase [Xylanibacillus composti]|uniref:Peptidyl-prolyl cis-trans isomerase n=1 Tax=Xylanibacillus composti TaxID=1572762 RepID=A0A8J4H2E0_9BACL|nr:peptidylprolyl isomerase [Xylanibacillus composti]GIQ68142.1 peptidyl-prolyl cis-trans isomerase [Xylanibacillus composti]